MLVLRSWVLPLKKPAPPNLKPVHILTASLLKQKVKFVPHPLKLLELGVEREDRPFTCGRTQIFNGLDDVGKLTR